MKGMFGLRPGDVLYIVSLDRLSRNKADIKSELDWFKENKIRLMILDLPSSLISENVIAKLIGQESSKKWQGVLSKLKVGECVVSGHFAVNHKSKSLEGALACRVVSENQK